MPGPIPRDVTFSSHFADGGFAYLVGANVDLAFLQNGPALVEEEAPGEDGSTGIVAEAARVEVCRLRLPPNRAIALSFDILEELVGDKRTNKKALRLRLSSLIEKIDSFDAEQVTGVE